MNAITEYQMDALRALARVAIEATKDASASVQSQIYTALSIALSPSLPIEGAAAANAAQALRQAESFQMTFEELLNP